MMVMNAFMMNSMALNSAIGMTIRNLVFGPQGGPKVKYVNYGYKKNNNRPELIVHSPAAFVKQPTVSSSPPKPIDGYKGGFAEPPDDLPTSYNSFYSSGENFAPSDDNYFPQASNNYETHYGNNLKFNDDSYDDYSSEDTSNPKLQRKRPTSSSKVRLKIRPVRRKIVAKRKNVIKLSGPANVNQLQSIITKYSGLNKNVITRSKVKPFKKLPTPRPSLSSQDYDSQDYDTSEEASSYTYSKIKPPVVNNVHDRYNSFSDYTTRLYPSTTSEPIYNYQLTTWASAYKPTTYNTDIYPNYNNYYRNNYDITTENSDLDYSHSSYPSYKINTQNATNYQYDPQTVNNSPNVHNIDYLNFITQKNQNQRIYNQTGYSYTTPPVSYSNFNSYNSVSNENYNTRSIDRSRNGDSQDNSAEYRNVFSSKYNKDLMNFGNGGYNSNYQNHNYAKL